MYIYLLPRDQFLIDRVCMCTPLLSAGPECCFDPPEADVVERVTFKWEAKRGEVRCSCKFSGYSRGGIVCNDPSHIN